MLRVHHDEGMGCSAMWLASAWYVSTSHPLAQCMTTSYMSTQVNTPPLRVFLYIPSPKTCQLGLQVAPVSIVRMQALPSLARERQEGNRRWQVLHSFNDWAWQYTLRSIRRDGDACVIAPAPAIVMQSTSLVQLPIGVEL